MRKFINLAIIIAAILLTDTVTQAQQHQPAWIPNEGYWVVVTNVHAGDEATIRFYDNADKLLYEEVVAGRKLRVNSRKTKMLLKNCLEQVLALSKKDGGEMGKRELVIAQIHQR